MSEETRAAFERLDRFHAFWDAHYDEMRGKYPDEFVAVIDQTVVAHSKDFLALDDELDRRPEGRAGLQIRFVRVNSPSFVL